VGGFRALVAAFALVPAVAYASSQAGQQSIAKWKLMDTCAKQAQTAFPDFTAESNAKREARLKACLSGSNLPPRDPIAAPSQGK